jgi:chorismate mutase/prephenate dehydratase
VTLEKLRQEIDSLDESLVRLLNERAKVCQEIGALKRDLNVPILHSAREAEVIARVTAKNTGPLTDETVEAIYKLIITSCRTLQEKEIEHANRNER